MNNTSSAPPGFVAPSWRSKSPASWVIDVEWSANSGDEAYIPESARQLFGEREAMRLMRSRTQGNAASFYATFGCFFSAHPSELFSVRDIKDGLKEMMMIESRWLRSCVSDISMWMLWCIHGTKNGPWEWRVAIREFVKEIQHILTERYANDGMISWSEMSERLHELGRRETSRSH